ncbi:MAG TPA: D-alanine--D-alanine ligase [Pseudomonadales bacterium]|jgi:D-alanine-D-alanine ligase|nr:D-alanine--D-alanine ligase [Pseudomonadales bacterium]
MSNAAQKKYGHVAVLYGGLSSERAISLKSGQAVTDALLRSGVSVEAVDVDANFLSVLTEQQTGKRQKWDRVFIALHGVGGEDGSMQAVLDMAGIPYTGSGVLASALGMDKWRTKMVWQAQHLPTPAYALLHETTDWNACITALGGCAIVKPACEGSSIGMRRVISAQELQEAFVYAKQFAGAVLAEAWVTGAEFTVAILNGKALPAIRLETDHAFYDFDAKYLSNSTRYLCPCGLSAEQEKNLQQLAENAFAAVGCAGWGRVDVMQDAQGNFYLLEVNTVPGMTDHSLVPMAAQAAGLSFDALVLTLLDGTLSGRQSGIGAL